MLTVTVAPTRVTRAVHIAAAGANLVGELTLPSAPRGLVVFVEAAAFLSTHVADGTIAHVIEHSGFATLRLDLLTPVESLVDDATGGLTRDISLLSRRLIQIVDWATVQPSLARLPIALFVTGSGAAAALVASVAEHGRIAAIVITAGRLEQAVSVLPKVTTPTLLIAAGEDAIDVRDCEAAVRLMPGRCEVALLHGTRSRFDLAGAVDDIGQRALDWFDRHLGRRPGREVESEVA